MAITPLTINRVDTEKQKPVLGASIATSQGVSSNTQQEPQTASQAGQGAQSTAVQSAVPDTTTTQATQKTAAENLQELTSSRAIVENLIQKGLDAKVAQQPYQKRIAVRSGQLAKMSIDDYKNMPISDALQFFRNKQSQLVQERSYFQQKLEEAQQNALEEKNAIAEILNSQIQAAGLQVTSEQDMRDFAFSGPVLLAGKMPPGLSPQYQDSWKAASAEAQRQQALAERPRGGGGTSIADKQAEAEAQLRDKINNEAADTVAKLDAKEISWATAWDTFKRRYPQLSNEAIDSLLGGKADTSLGGGDMGRAKITQDIVDDFQQGL